MFLFSILQIWIKTFYFIHPQFLNIKLPFINIVNELTKIVHIHCFNLTRGLINYKKLSQGRNLIFSIVNLNQTSQIIQF